MHDDDGLRTQDPYCCFVTDFFLCDGHFWELLNEVRADAACVLYDTCLLLLCVSRDPRYGGEDASTGSSTR